MKKPELPNGNATVSTFISKTTFLIVFIFLGMAFNGHSQVDLVWGKQFGTNAEEYVRNLVIDRGGNVYVSGNTMGVMNDKNFGKNDGFVAKIDSTGNIVWSAQFGSDEDEDIQWSAIDRKDNVYIIGNTTGVLGDKNYGKQDFFILKYSPSGEKIWTKQFGSDSTDSVLGIFIDNEGYIYLAGSTSGVLGKSTSGNDDAFIMKLDNNGTPVFTEQFGTESRDGCSAVTGDNFGNVYVVGSTFGKIGANSFGLMDGFIGHFTDKGVLINYTQYGSEGFDIPTSISVDNKKNIYSGGTTSGDFAGQQSGEGDCFLVKTDENGSVLWHNQFGTPKHDGVKCIIFKPEVSENIMVSGLLNLPPAHAFVRMYKQDGTLLWEKKIVADSDTRDASGKSVAADNYGNIYHLGLTSSDLFGPLIGVTDFYLVRYKLN